MKTIPLTKGMVAAVDDEDYDYLMQWSWYALWNGRAFYAAGGQRLPDGSMDHFLMHRVILRAKEGEFVDHRDLNTLDNRKENLRHCTKGQNGMNSRRRRDSTTGFKGVSTTPNGRWRATIQVDGKSKWIGSFPNAQEAAMAYDLAAYQNFGVFARTNYSLGLVSEKLYA